MSIYDALALVQHDDLLIQLVAYPHRQLPLSGDGRSQRIELRVLLGQDLFVVCVNLRVGEAVGLDLVTVAGCFGVVAVGEEGVAGCGGSGLGFEVEVG